MCFNLREIAEHSFRKSVEAHPLALHLLTQNVFVKLKLVSVLRTCSHQPSILSVFRYYVYENVRQAFATQFFSPMAQKPLVGQCLLTFEASRSNSRHGTIGRTSDRPNAETSTWQNTTLKRQTIMAPSRFKPTIPTSERPQTQTLERTGTRIALLHKLVCSNRNPPCMSAERTYSIFH